MRVLSAGCELVSPRWRWVFDIGSSGSDLTPLSNRRGAALFECLAIDDMAFQIEVIADTGVDRGKLL